MARDRQRAKQRKQRQAPQPPSRSPDDGDGVAPEPDHLHRENVPGPWEHGGEVDRFEAELVAGAGGEPADDPDAAERASTGNDADAQEVHDGVDGADSTPPPGGGAISAAGAGDPAPSRGPGRFWTFLKACWAELQRVQWPNRRQVGQATMVVLGFVIVAGAFLGLADYVANELVNLII